jgi:hypothetical protein
MGSPHSVRERDRSTLNDHFRSHPNTPVAHQSWADDQTLHVAVAYSNPCRWRTRRELFENFRRHVAGLPNVRLYVGELAYGDRNFEVTSGTTRWTSSGGPGTSCGTRRTSSTR